MKIVQHNEAMRLLDISNSSQLFDPRISETYLSTKLGDPEFSHDTLVREVVVGVNKVSLNDVMIIRILSLNFFL